MRKPILIATLALLCVTSFTSCVRQYICQCTISFSGYPGLPDTLVNEYVIQDKKETARNLCEQASTKTTDAETGITTTEDCKLY